MEALARDPGGAPLGARVRALVALALALTRAPAGMREDDVRALRAVGLSDRGVHDAVAVVAYLNFVNRLAHGLGVALEPEAG